MPPEGYIHVHRPFDESDLNAAGEPEPGPLPAEVIENLDDGSIFGFRADDADAAADAARSSAVDGESAPSGALPPLGVLPLPRGTIFDPTLPAPPVPDVSDHIAEVAQERQQVRPLVEPVTPYSSTPLSIRETDPSLSICRHCAHGWEMWHAAEVASQSFTGLKMTNYCTAVKPVREITDTVMYRCSRYTPDAARPRSEVKGRHAIAAEIRSELHLTAPPAATAAPPPPPPLPSHEAST